MQNFNRIKELLNRPFPKSKIKGTDIPLFAIRKPEKERLKDKYEKNYLYQDLYTGVYAYGYQTMHTGGCESLYRTIDSIILSNLNRGQEYLFLDLGCGTGRTLYDLAPLYPESWFVGLDFSYNMLRRANQILLENNLPPVDLSSPFGSNSSNLKVEMKKITNLNLIQGSALDIPFNDESFDCLTNTFLIDRTKEQVEKNIQESVRVLKKGGLFILTDPLNFESADDWLKFESKDKIVDLIRESGIEVQEYFNDLVFRELKDVTGSYTDFRTLVIWGVKK